MPSGDTLRALLEQVRDSEGTSLRQLSVTLANDPRSDISAERWRRYLHGYLTGRQPDRANATILADHLPGRPTPDDLIGVRPRGSDADLAAQIVAVEDGLAELRVQIEELRADDAKLVDRLERLAAALARVRPVANGQ